jgi:hypothetical protein
MLLRVSLLLVSLSGVAACTTNSYCLVDQDYQKAEIVPELQPVEGLAIPASPSALRLPDRPATAVAFGHKNEEGDGVCLDRPPPYVAPEKAPGADKADEPEVEVPKS